jgi:hypothetical protein
VSAAQASDTLDVLLARLQESHEVSVYEAIERLVQCAEAVGLDQHTLVRMLDGGITFEELLEYIEARIESSQRAVESAAKTEERRDHCIVRLS